MTMSATLKQGTRSVPSRAYLIVGMLFIFQTLNFFDKLGFGISAISIMKEFSLSPKQYGLMGAAFFVFYAVGGTITGLFFVGRYPTKWILAGLATIWTVSQYPIYFSHSIGTLIICRFLLGLGEGGALATAMTAAYEWFPEKKRNLPTAVILQGVGAGFLIGGPLITHIMLHYGWRGSFFFCGTLSLLWVLLWSLLGATGPLSGKHNGIFEDDPLPTRVLWLDKTVIGVMIMAFMGYWVIGMSAVWLPPYLRMGLGYSASSTGWIISAIYIVQSPILLLGGWLTQVLRNKSWSARICLGHTSALAMLVAGIAMVVAVLSPTGKYQIALLAIAFSVPSLTTIFGPVILASIAPAVQRGQLIVVAISGTSISAFLSTFGNGWIVSKFPQNLHLGYEAAFLVGGIVMLICAVTNFCFLFPEQTKARFERIKAEKNNSDYKNQKEFS